MGFVGNLLGFPAVKNFENPLRIDKVIAMSSVCSFLAHLVYHNSISLFTKYQPLLLLFTYFLIHAYLTQTTEVFKLLDAAKILTKILTIWVGRNNVADDRHGRTAHAIRRT